MKKNILFIMGCLLTFNMSFAQPSIYPNDQNWRLYWHDDFTSLNTNIWEIRNNNDSGVDPCVSIASNVYLNNDTLVLITKKESQPYCCPTTPHNYVNQWECKNQWKTGECYQYTGAYMTTEPDYNTKYGYIEAKIKMTFRPGVGYAFWTFRGIDQNYSNPAEIDIFETMVPEIEILSPNTLSTCVHTCYWDSVYHNPVWNPDCHKPGMQMTYYNPNFNFTQWHIYAMEWDVDWITWYIDGKVIRKKANINHDTFDNSVVDPVKIILSAHVNPDRLTTSASFTEYMYVDYIKVYQLKCDKNTPVTIIPNFDTYNYAVKKYIKLDGNTTVPPNKNIALRAAEYIELNDGFYVPDNTELYLDITPCELPPPPPVIMQNKRDSVLPE